MGPSKIPFQTASESFFWLERKELRNIYGGIKGNYLSTEKASKQANTFFHSEQHLDSEIKKRRAQK